MFATTIFTSSLLLIAFTHAQSTGCGHNLPRDVKLGDSVNLRLDNSKSGVASRKYRIHIPASYKKNVPVPLIVSFHGRTQDMEYQERLSQFSNSTYGFQGISVYPEGIPSSTGSYQWQGDPEAPDSINDVTFTLELLDLLLDTYCIDPSRVYAAGKSNGGGFSAGVLACDDKASKRFAAFAAVSGAYYLDPTTKQLPPCKPGRDIVPILEFHGLNDTTIDYYGGPNNRVNGITTDILKWVHEWVERDGLDVNSVTTTPLCANDSRSAIRYSWKDTVVHYAIKNWSHDWPSTFPNEDTGRKVCKDEEATSIILAWFAKWTL
ncbi:Alpha/Beta hydrolase protein [Massariosphaeria phaeospora]|uniref:feruloyl esterase n=1 Tax=Massariosphaeria phaeospora TaxID=100035 RepID=A0A7C8M4W8_9PLEO|nr:Alpha/Beta hydrolase protein [Massariosphaeria phaeospora]